VSGAGLTVVAPMDQDETGPGGPVSGHDTAARSAGFPAQRLASAHRTRGVLGERRMGRPCFG
jgi:hypothetical protein